MIGLALFRESKWLLAFASIALCAAALLRPPPRFPAPEHYRIVKDAAGVEVPIETPFRGSVLTWCGFGAGGYLGHTHSPGTLMSAGTAVDRERFTTEIWSRIYRQTSASDELWTGKFRRRFAAIEAMLAYDAGAYLGACGEFGVVPSLQSIGLPALSLMWHEKNWDESLFVSARVETALIDEPERGEALIAAYKRAYAALEMELQSATLPQRPRILIMGSHHDDRGHLYVKNEKNSYQIYLPPAGVVNAANRSVAQGPDAERILLMDPDMIFLMGNAQTPQEFANDPRWRGLKAVTNRRVYRMPGDPFGGGALAGLHFQPLWVRWMAEIAHSDRLQPRLREQLREHFVTDFGYRLTDEQIDQFLHIDENANSVGYARFTREHSAGATMETSHD